MSAKNESGLGVGMTKMEFPDAQEKNSGEVSWSSYSEFRLLNQVRNEQDKEHETTLQIMLAGNCNTDFLIPGIAVNLSRDGFGTSFSTTAFNNWIPETFLNSKKIDIWVVWLSVMGATNGMTRGIDIEAAEVAGACRRIIEGGGTVIVIPPEPSVFEDEAFSEDSVERARQVDLLISLLPESAVVLSVEQIFARVGALKWTAPRYWEQAKIPCHPDAMSWVATEVAVTIARLIRPKVKAIIVDLDDTLWGGIVGEVGPEGISIDPAGSGRPYLELQRYLKTMLGRGIALAVVSKNDRDQAMRPFTEVPEMILKMEDFAGFEASWDPKFKSIEKTRQKLNVGIDSICFIDDSIQERNEARHLLPGLIVPELPKSPGERVTYLSRTRLFTTPRITDEDKKRIEFYKRETIPSDDSLDQYLADLEMVMEPLQIDSNNLDRCLELLQKTNQFNSSLWRPSSQDLRGFVEDQSNYSYCFKLSDRLGDAGITSVLLAEKNLDEFCIRGWVVSCRVFSRGFEWAIFDHFLTFLRKLQVENLVIDLKVGPRNAMVKNVLRDLNIDESMMTGDLIKKNVASLQIPNYSIKVK